MVLDDDDDKLFYVMVDRPRVSKGTEVPITENPDNMKT